MTETAAFLRSLTLLARGRWTEGWPLYEQRSSRLAMLRHPLTFPEWKGEALKGKRLLVYREQGFGDQIMMARYYRDLGAAEITYAGAPDLQRLFETLGLTYLAFTPNSNISVSGHDYWTLPMSIPYRTGTIRPNLVKGAPYISVAPRPMAARIGVAWRTNPNSASNAVRAIPDSEAARLLSALGAISLHPEETGTKDFLETAQIVAGVDLVITTDSAIAHLAGALGRPTMVLLPTMPEWRWERAGERCRWYDSVRLIRQAKPGDWRGPIDQVLRRLDRSPDLKFAARARA